MRNCNVEYFSILNYRSGFIMHGYTYPPCLFYTGNLKKSIILEQAQKDTGGINKLNEVRYLFDIPARGLMARIRRYADGENLRKPEEINDEKFPFRAIKHAHCTDWKKFQEENGSVEDLDHLRAYFWDQDEKIMCITHFILKKQKDLHPKDTKISLEEKDKFERNGCDFL